jgi:large subunit ribosomal protein L13
MPAAGSSKAASKADDKTKSTAPAARRSHRTFHADQSFQHAWFVADVGGKTLGRAATKIASVLRGKHRPTFTTHADAGDFVVVINAEKVKLTGKKWTDKLYQDHSQYPGGLKTRNAQQLMEKHPTDLVKRAVWGMLPKGPLGRRIYKKLKVYAGTEHPHLAQQPKQLAL